MWLKGKSKGKRYRWNPPPGGFSDLINQNNQNSNWKKLLGFRNMQVKLKNKFTANSVHNKPPRVVYLATPLETTFWKITFYFVFLIRRNELLEKMWRRSRMSNSIAGSKFFKNFFLLKIEFPHVWTSKWFRGLLNGAWRHILCSEIRLKNSEWLTKSSLIHLLI